MNDLGERAELARAIEVRKSDQPTAIIIFMRSCCRISAAPIESNSIALSTFNRAFRSACNSGTLAG
jgi:hypothetical protein